MKPYIMNQQDLAALIFELFHQACYIEGQYDHMGMSIYKETQNFLISIGKIKEEDCCRK